MKDPIINSLACDRRNNCVWMGTDGKLLSYKINNRHIETVCELSGSYLKSIVSDVANNRLLIGTEAGMLVYQISTKSLQEIEHDVHNPQSLCNNFISQLYQDKNNNLWVATDNGISMVQQNPLMQDVKLTDLVDSKMAISLLVYCNLPTKNIGLVERMVYSMCLKNKPFGIVQIMYYIN